MRNSAVQKRRSTVQLRQIYSRFVHVWIFFLYVQYILVRRTCLSSLNKVLPSNVIPRHWVSLSVDLSLYVIFQYIIAPLTCPQVVLLFLSLSNFRLLILSRCVLLAKQRGRGERSRFCSLRFMDACRYELKPFQATLSRQGRRIYSILALFSIS